MLILAIVSLVFNILILVAVLLLWQKQKSSPQLENQFAFLKESQDRTERIVKEEIAHNREELSLSVRQSREEMAKQVSALTDSLLKRMTESGGAQKNQLDSFSKQLLDLTKINEQKLEAVRETVEKRLGILQEENSKKLEQMRATVDEKLHATLEKRLGESFKLVSDRLEMVHKGLGEMQTLAVGVGDLKKVLTNVKTRGTWGEIQLGNLLEQILTPDQYEKNVMTRRGSKELVEFALKLPGKNDQVVWLPMDSKFPREDYERLQEAQDQANPVLVEELGRALENRIKSEAKDIRDKYLDPPNTTDFGILFLPIEGLYAEVLRRPGLSDFLQREYRILLTGPTTIAALLNSLQMGFRTLAIEKRASEVWNLLSVIKSEFGKFGDILIKTRDKLKQATDTIDDAASKSRTIERKLKKVQDLPTTPTVELIADIDEVLPEPEHEPDHET